MEWFKTLIVVAVLANMMLFVPARQRCYSDRTMNWLRVSIAFSVIVGVWANRRFYASGPLTGFNIFVFALNVVQLGFEVSLLIGKNRAKRLKDSVS